jgi:hypothetical protein
MGKTGLYVLLAAAAVQCMWSGDPSGEGFAFMNFLYTGRPYVVMEAVILSCIR